MSDDENDSFWPPNKVGYKNPPKSRRFTKGKSGNPRGRFPKKKTDPKPHVDKSTMETVLKVALREVTVRDGEDISKTPIVDAVIQTMAAAAMKGNVQAQKAFVELVDRARKDQAAEIQDDHAFWRDYAATYDKNVEALLKTGEPLPEHLIHPDDLVFEEGRHVTVRGGDPIIATRNRNLRVRFREVFILQAEKDRRHFCKASSEKHPPIFVSDYLVMQINASLPKRMQLDDTNLIARALRAQTFGKTELEKQLRIKWAELEIPEARSLITPPIRSII